MSQAQYLSAFNFFQAGDFAQAETLLQKIVSSQANFADAWHLLGIIYYQSNRVASAVASIQKALVLVPKNVDYLNNYGLALRADGQMDLALKTFQQALLLSPKDLDIQLNIANLYQMNAQYVEAANYYRRIYKIQPKRDDVREALCHALTALGNAAHLQGNFLQAELAFSEAVTLAPSDAFLHYNLGNALREVGKLALAKQHYEKAILIEPNDADFYNNLGNILRELGQLDLAIKHYQKALQLNPKLYHAKVHLVHQLQHCCDWQDLDAMIEVVRDWVKHIPEAQISPFAFLAMPNTNAVEQKLCASNWAQNRYKNLICAKDALNFSYANHSNKKIKIGYLSADFRLHPLAFLITELIEQHDRNKFEIIGYSFGINDQSLARKRLESAFDQFHDIRPLSELDAAKKINAENIDILVDLTGFTQTSRSGIVALKPAKIHVNWLGFAGTMGNINTEKNAPLFDYLLTDALISPSENANNYAEKLSYLPCYQPNDSKRPVANTPTKTECGLPENAFVFACFNQSFKISQEIFEAWMRIINASPNSVLWLLECNIWAKENLHKHAEKFGIAKERIIFAPRIEIAKHLARHVHVDLFLDTLPYNAHTTCSDALWMNVPVLTLVGETFASRVAGSLLNTLNLIQLLTYQLQDYENKALFFYHHPQELIKIKEKIAAEKMHSPLFNTKIFLKHLEENFQAMLKSEEKDG